jgi:acyl transferase domain-containing protein
VRAGPVDHRAVVTGADHAELVRSLAALARGEHPAGVAPRTPGRLAVLFTGQGAQRPAWARHCARRSRSSPRRSTRCAQSWTSTWSRPAEDVIATRPDLLDQTGYTQAALFAVEVALYRLAESWGVRPDFLGGHSIGELVAAHVAGVWSLPDAARLVAARGRLMQALPPGGAMIAVAATEDEVRPLLTPARHRRRDGPASVVLSGAEPAVEEIAAGLAAVGRRTKRLTVSHAFHSALMEPMLAEFGAVAASVDYAAATIPVVSNATGRSPDPTSPHRTTGCGTCAPRCGSPTGSRRWPTPVSPRSSSWARRRC